MAGPWVINADIKQDVADILKVDVAELEDYWVRQIANAIASGYRDIKNLMLDTGWSMAQLDSWDDRISYTRQQTMFWLFTETPLGLGMDDREVLKLDQRKTLKDLTTLAINGQLVPLTTAEHGGSVGGGLMDDSKYRINGSTEF